MQKLSFSTKAQTLEELATRLATARVLPLVHFSSAEWQREASRILGRIASLEWGSSPLIVRSSAIGEDGANESFAGRFRSILNVSGAEALAGAIGAVIKSYGDHESADHRVLVQPLLIEPAMSGVVFSHDPNSGAPYIVVNYETAGDTTAVTGGVSIGLRTSYLWRHGPTEEGNAFSDIIALVNELEVLYDGMPLDIEFARTASGDLVVLQVRPLTAGNRTKISTDVQTAALSTIAAKIESSNRGHPFLKGQRTVYGVMPDWNPAEIIGTRPRPLALSLYREIITDSIWAYQRHNYGYQNLRSFPLLVDFQGLPYIDVRVSFNSFIPADIPDELGHRLVDYYVRSLLETPSLHDKVEFEIVFSCYSFDIRERMRSLEKAGFSKAECELLASCLNRLTNRIIHRDTGLWRNDLARIETLTKRQATIMTAEMDTISRIYWLLEDCKRYGTLPFAGLARAGFIAVQMLKSLTTQGVLSEKEQGLFMNGLDTIGTEMRRDFSALDRTAFLSKYGHLRPGTYDISSPRYDEAPDLYFDWARRDPVPAQNDSEAFSLSLGQMKMISGLLEEHNLDHDVVGLFEFFQAGIRGREYSKFVFTRNLSEALRCVGRLGDELGFSLDEMSYLDIRAIYALFSSAADARQTIASSIERGKKAHELTKAIVLPPLITSGADVWAFEMPPTEPNYITQHSVTGAVARLDRPADMRGKIALIANADPGFDWIFARGVAGFVTAYGGVNSHMAIRAAELSLPAIIGAGETLFGKLAAADVIEIDAANRQVRIIR